MEEAQCVCGLACQPLATGQRVQFIAHPSTESDYTPTPSFFTPWLPDWPGAYSSALARLQEVALELLEKNKACPLDARGVTRVYFCWPAVVLSLKLSVFVYIWFCVERRLPPQWTAESIFLVNIKLSS